MTQQGLHLLSPEPTLPPSQVQPPNHSTPSTYPDSQFRHRILLMALQGKGPGGLGQCQTSHSWSTLKLPPASPQGKVTSPQPSPQGVSLCRFGWLLPPTKAKRPSRHHPLLQASPALTIGYSGYRGL